MKHFLSINNLFKSERTVDFLLIFSIIIVSLIIRFLFIDRIPTNISGDETTNLSDVYRILYGKIGPFSFSGDGSIAAIVFYPAIFFIKLFGIENSIFFLRVNTIIFSILSLIAFYFILRDKTSNLIAFLFTLLLSSNYVFLNFSRTAWINMTCVFSGLFSIYFIEKGIKESKIKWYLLAGIFTGLNFYGYHYGRILALSIFLFLFIRFFSNFNKKYFKNFAVFSITAFIVFLPFFSEIIKDHGSSILRRPNSTYVFSEEKIKDRGDLEEKIKHQTEYTIRGLLLLDKNVMNEGVENTRYVPRGLPPVDIFIKLIFIISLAFSIFQIKKNPIWFFVFISILITVFITEFPPNFSRGIFYIPFIYLISGVFIFNILEFLKIKTNFPGNLKTVALMAISIVLFFYNCSLYFSWMKTQEIYNNRQPAIDYTEFPNWQDYQIKRVESNLFPITNYEWYSIKENVIKN